MMMDHIWFNNKIHANLNRCFGLPIYETQHSRWNICEKVLIFWIGCKQGLRDLGTLCEVIMSLSKALSFTNFFITSSLITEEKSSVYLSMMEMENQNPINKSWQNRRMRNNVSVKHNLTLFISENSGAIPTNNKIPILFVPTSFQG